MSLAQLTFTQLRLLQLLCFLLPVIAALFLSVVARQNRAYVWLQIVDERGAPISGVVSTVVGRGPREKIRAIGRLDEDGCFRRIFTPFEPRTLLVQARGIEEGLLPLAAIATRGAFAATPRRLVVVDGALAMRDAEGPG